MKQQERVELREQETSDLQRELAEQQKQLYALRSQAVTEKLENPHQMSETRKQIARLKTLLRERQLEAETKAAAESDAAEATAKA